MDDIRPLVVNAWTLFAHPLSLDQLEALTARVEALKRKDPVGYVNENATKRLVAIAKLAFEGFRTTPPVRSTDRATPSATACHLRVRPLACRPSFHSCRFPRIGA